MNENTFAFPHEITHLQKPLTAGMTLRDYFAAKAMHEIVAQGGDWGDANYAAPAVVAAAAYHMADAMLKAREE
jgi:hypothetical protein